MDPRLHSSQSEKKVEDNRNPKNGAIRSNHGEKKIPIATYSNNTQNVDRSAESHVQMDWIHNLMDSNESRGQYMLETSEGTIPLQNMPHRSYLQPKNYSLNSNDNLIDRIVGPESLMSFDSSSLYNYNDYTRIGSETSTNEQNEVKECIDNLIKVENGEECSNDANTENAYSDYQSLSCMTDLHQKGDLYCVICQKYAKTFEDLQRHMLIDHPDQAPYSLITESSNHSTALPLCPSCKIELRKINIYDQQYHVEGVQDAEQVMTLAQNSDIFVVCDQCGKEFTLCLGTNPPSKVPSSESLKHHFCQYCEKGYKHIRDLRKHLKTQHGIVEDASKANCFSRSNSADASLSTDKTDPQQQTHKISCEMCKKTFRGPFELRRHKLTVHENKRPYKCSDCAKYFRDAYELKRHSLSHQRNYILNNSSVRLAPGQIMPPNVHRLSNIKGQDEGIGVLGVCQAIGSSVMTDTYGGQHPVTYPSSNANNIDYFCNSCEKTFRGSNEFKRHHSIVHEKKYRYKCFHCGKLWRDQYDLKRHCRRSHFIDREIDRAFIKKCLIDNSNQTSGINSASQPTPISSISGYGISHNIPINISNETSASIFGVTSDRNMSGGNNHMDHSYNLGQDHISIPRSSSSNPMFRNLPSAQSAITVYHSLINPSPHLVEDANQPQQFNDHATEESQNAIHWSNFECDIEIKKSDYS